MLYNEATNDTHPYIGIDIGGTNTRIGLFSSLDTPRFELLTKFPTVQSYQEQLETLVTSIANFDNPSFGGVGDKRFQLLLVALDSRELRE